MPKYSVMIEGRDFPARLFEDEDSDMGFFALRHVTADSPEQAELVAVQMIRDEYRPLLGQRKPGEANPTMHLEKLIELEDFPADVITRGATWFPMGS